MANSDSKPDVIVSGVRLSLVMPWGELEWVDCFEGGTESITFSVQRRHPLFRPGAIVELDRGGVRRAVASMIEPQPGDQITAEGLHRLCEDEPALNGTGDIADTVHVAFDAAIARGLPLVHGPDGAASPYDLSPVPLVDGVPNLDLTQPHSLAQYFDASAQRRGAAWWVEPTTRRVRMDPWPTAPTLHMLPGLEGLAISRDGYASTLTARYLDSATSTYRTVTRVDLAAQKRWGRTPRIITSLLGEGAPMTEAAAVALVDGLLARGASQIGWASPIEVQFGDVVNERQEAVDLSAIDRQALRLHGLDRSVVDLQGRTTFDVPLARVHHRADGTALLEPRGLSSPMNDVLAGIA